MLWYILDHHSNSCHLHRIHFLSSDISLFGLTRSRCGGGCCCCHYSLGWLNARCCCRCCCCCRCWCCCCCCCVLHELEFGSCAWYEVTWLTDGRTRRRSSKKSTCSHSCCLAPHACSNRLRSRILFISPKYLFGPFWKYNRDEDDNQAATISATAALDDVWKHWEAISYFQESKVCYSDST